MATVRTFGADMIKQFLEDDDLYFYVDRDGDYVVPTGNMMINLTISGSRKDVYSIMCFLPENYPGSRVDEAMRACNEWNKERRWPKAYVRVRDEDGTCYIVLEESLDLETGIHQEFINDFTRLLIMTCLSFKKWASEQGL